MQISTPYTPYNVTDNIYIYISRTQMPNPVQFSAKKFENLGLLTRGRNFNYRKALIVPQNRKF